MNPESSISAVRQRWCTFVCSEQAERLPDAEGWLSGAKVWNTCFLNTCWQTQTAKLEAEQFPRQRKKNTYTKYHVFYKHVKKDRDMTNEWQWDQHHPTVLESLPRELKEHGYSHLRLCVVTRLYPLDHATRSPAHKNSNISDNKM